jgi:branched-chain amino acid transport system permease protein
MIQIKNKNMSAWIAISAGLIIFPFILGDGYYLSVMNFIALYSIVAIGLCLLTGYGGQLSMAHAAFFGIGAYTSAILSTRFGINPLISIPIAQVITAIAAWGIGSVVLRLKGHYLAIATLSFTIIVEIIIIETAWLTGGLQGLSSIPYISFGNFIIDTDWKFYFIIWPITMLLMLFSLNLVNSRMGRIFRATKENEDIVRLFGADVKKYKVKLFVLSSIFASLSGSFYAHFISFVSPSAGSIMFAIDIIMVLAFGGFTILWGALLGAASLTFLNEYLTVFADYKRAIYGAALILIMLFFPNGLLEGLKDSISRIIHTKGIGEDS